jgi:hypothetical protein
LQISCEVLGDTIDLRAQISKDRARRVDVAQTLDKKGEWGRGRTVIWIKQVVQHDVLA